MKSVVVLAVICWLALSGASLASPVPEIPSNGASKTSNSLESSGRQAVAPVASAAPTASDDDDDDDDDEDDLDVDLDISDDDDDDEDDDEDGGGTGGSDDDDDDDDEDDYLERFIDDILGGDEDDDDDDETASVVEPVQPAAPVPAPAPVQAVQPIVQAAPSIPAAVQADLNALSAEAAAEEAANIAETSASEAESASYEDEEVGETVPEGQAATNLESGLIGGNIEGVESQGNPVVNAHQVAPVIIQQPTGTTPDEDDDDDDDEDDEDDDVDLEIPEIDEDDDDDDDEDEDDDDDDDDDDTDARQARAMETNTNNHVPAIYVAKYNRFVDNILGRINKILRTNYDPVTVKLTNPSPSTKSKTKSTKKKTKKNGGKKNGSKKSASGSSTNDQSVDKVQQINDLATSPATKSQEIGQKNFKDVTTTPIPDNISNAIPEAVATTPRAMEIITLQEPENRASATTTNKKQKTKRTKTKNKTKNKAPSSGSTPNKNKPKVKKQSKPKARATLYGLSSLKRSGDVSVNMMRDHTTIRTKFRLGPLMLKVEKEFGRAAKKELRSAIATTAEMSGKLSLRVMHGGAATLHSIRVLQPKQVRVESADDHDRTREFVWRRSSHIAHLVSQKLSSATRSMLRPPPIPATSA